ncbi:MAG: GNAT family N-acetyltransferase [Chloroflexi bacterium]|nr:GNAT family N-acetyltransferase [Chloroflexota bacterium]
MAFSVHTESFESLQREWRDLAAASPTRSVFTTPAWLHTWWQTQRTGEEPALLAFRDGGRLLGLAPMMRSADAVRLLAATDVCDYHDVLYRPEAEEAFYPALVGAFERHGWLRVELEGIIELSPTLRRLTGAALGKGWTVEQQVDGVSPEIALPASWEAYLESLDGKDRHELKRKLRKLTGAGRVDCFDALDRQPLAEVMTTFATLMRSSREDKAQFLTPERERFFRTLAEAMQKEGWLRVYFLTLDGHVTAASMLFDYDNGFYLYNSGYDTRYAPLSVGLLVKALCMQEAIAKGRKLFNFLRGSEPYKYSLGAKDVRLHKLTLKKG